MKKNQKELLALKNIVTEMKNSMDWENSRLGTDERGIKKPEHRAIETAQNAAYRDRISKQR